MKRYVAYWTLLFALALTTLFVQCLSMPSYGMTLSPCPDIPENFDRVFMLHAEQPPGTVAYTAVFARWSCDYGTYERLLYVWPVDSPCTLSNYACMSNRLTDELR